MLQTKPRREQMKRFWGSTVGTTNIIAMPSRGATTALKNTSKIGSGVTYNVTCDVMDQAERHESLTQKQSPYSKHKVVRHPSSRKVPHRCTCTFCSSGGRIAASWTLLQLPLHEARELPPYRWGSRPWMKWKKFLLNNLWCGWQVNERPLRCCAATAA